MRCGQSTFETATKGGLLYARYRCKSWKCPHCSPRRLKRLAKEAYLGRPNAFLTLTVKPEQFSSKEAAARSLVDGFKRMREAIQRKKKIGPIPFIAIFEECQSGWPHLHILWRGPYVPQAWISQYMHRRIKSPVVWITKIRSRKKAAAYVAKYVGKAPAQFVGCKRYWRNTEYIPKARKHPKSEHKWFLSHTSLERIALYVDNQYVFDDLLSLERLFVPPTGPPEYHWQEEAAAA